MRRILVDEKLLQTVVKFNKDLFTGRDTKEFDLPPIRLANLKRLVVVKPEAYGLDAGLMTTYLSKVENEYQDILNADEAKMKSLIEEFEKIIPHDEVSNSNKFWTSVVCCMRYEDLREKEFLVLLEKLQIKTCIYCNSQLTLVIKKRLYQKNFPDRNIKKGDVRTWKGLLHLDHRHAKSHYPFLSSSFFNLYPSCGNCNQAKSDNPCDFILYDDGSQLDAFVFSLEDKAVVNYWAERDRDKLIVKLTHVKPDENKKFAEAYEDMFSIEKIYNTQKDMVEELVHKVDVYTKEYNQELVTSFNALFPDQAMLNRLIIGNYDRPEDIHKRPMAKFIQEIARDVKLIK